MNEQSKTWQTVRLQSLSTTPSAERRSSLAEVPDLDMTTIPYVWRDEEAHSGLDVEVGGKLTVLDGALQRVPEFSTDAPLVQPALPLHCGAFAGRLENAVRQQATSPMPGLREAIHHRAEGL